MAAGTWLNEQPAGPRLDSALASYASTVSREDAGSAMEWAVSISEEKLQQKTIRYLVSLENSIQILREVNYS